ncbi:MAG: T9SS type A sorting domain-containing protein [candidate division Zixibacteria bacterium]|nr:T9SS type A sorting domain-containing protein [candidate division Zixibacteria bacterium]
MIRIGKSLFLIFILHAAVFAESGISFLPNVNYVVGGPYSEPSSVSSGDFDGDGFRDLVVANNRNKELYLLFNNGDGTFGDSAKYSVLSNPVDVLVADLNADDHPDLATANGNAVSVLYNNGDGTFAEALNYECYSNASYVVAGDLDNDGDIDLVATTTVTNDFAVYLNQDNTAFSGVPVYYGDGHGAQAIALGDFDRNTTLDLAIVLTRDDAVQIWKNNGKAEFTKQGLYPVGRVEESNPNDIISTDINGDDRIDVVTVNTIPHDITLLLGNGNGSFMDTINLSTYSSNPIALIAADLDNDTDLDIVTANRYSGTISIFEAAGGGTFWYPFSIPVGIAEGPQPEDVHAADFNNDGAIDLAVPCFYYAGVTVLINAKNVPLDADDDDPSNLPMSVVLQQNYPNPFNPATTIAYDLPRRTEVTLTVYNLLGQAVITLIDDAVQSPGHHTVVWNGLVAGGREAASGFYFYQLKAGDFRQTRRMLLLK